MPITEERQTIQELRAAGFSEEQALLLAAKLEATAQATSQDLKGFIKAELGKLMAELDKRFADVDQRFVELEARFETRLAGMEARLAGMEARFEHALRVQLAAILTAFVGVTGLAVALIKLLP